MNNHFLFQYFIIIIIIIIYRLNVKGKLDRGLDFGGSVSAGLEAYINELKSSCDLSIEYYATDVPDKNPTNVEDLVKLIQEFPSRLRTINNGKGVPIKVMFFYCFLKEWLVNVL